MKRYAFQVVLLLAIVFVTAQVVKQQDLSGDVNPVKAAEPLQLNIMAWAGEGTCYPPQHVYVGGTVYVNCAYDGIILRDDVKVRGDRELDFSRVERSNRLPSGRRCPVDMSCFKVKLKGKRATKSAVYDISASKKLGLHQSWTVRMLTKVLKDCFDVDCKSYNGR
jgi:hypothetical protein